MTRYEINHIIRQLLGLSCSQLAKRVEVTKQTISNYERGKCLNRPTERVIELELDLAIESCDNDGIRQVCEMLKLKREARS